MGGLEVSGREREWEGEKGIGREKMVMAGRGSGGIIFLFILPRTN